MVSGQVTVVTAGTAVQGPDKAGTKFKFTGHPSNTGAIYIGNVDDDIDANNGFALVSGDIVELRVGGNLNNVYFDAATSGDVICWIAQG